MIHTILTIPVTLKWSIQVQVPGIQIQGLQRGVHCSAYVVIVLIYVIKIPKGSLQASVDSFLYAGNEHALALELLIAVNDYWNYNFRRYEDIQDYR